MEETNKQKVTQQDLERAYQNLKFAIVKASKQDIYNQLEGATINDAFFVIEEYLKNNKQVKETKDE